MKIDSVRIALLPGQRDRPDLRNELIRAAIKEIGVEPKRWAWGVYPASDDGMGHLFVIGYLH